MPRLAVTLLLFLVVPAQGATLLVDRTDDPDPPAMACIDLAENDCSLRGAITLADQEVGLDIIEIPAGHYVLAIAGADGRLLIRQTDLEIRGAGAVNTVIDGANITEVFEINNNIGVEPTVSISDLTITQGLGVGLGFRAGGITVSGVADLTLTRCMISENTGSLGGGVTSFGGKLTIEDSIIQHNTATIHGGGIQLGIEISVFINNSTVAMNVATFACGGICTFGSVEIHNSQISGNTSGGGIGGGGVGNFGELWVEDSTIANNQALIGAGISNRYPGMVTLVNSTISGNVATSRGGAILTQGPTKLTNSLVTGDCSGIRSGLLTGGGNLESPGGTCQLSPLLDQINVDPSEVQFGPLADNGGLTPTHALLPDSPAIDRAISPPCPSTDQRGAPRPAGIACDVGAFEADSAPPELPPRVAHHISPNHQGNSVSGGIELEPGTMELLNCTAIDNTAPIGGVIFVDPETPLFINGFE